MSRVTAKRFHLRRENCGHFAVLRTWGWDLKALLRVKLKCLMPISHEASGETLQGTSKGIFPKLTCNQANILRSHSGSFLCIILF